MDMFNVFYTDGSGREYSDGVWTVRRTPKRTIAEKIKESGVYDMHKVGDKIRIGKLTGNPIKYEEDDGSFVVYFAQAGTPYQFTPVDNYSIDKGLTRNNG